MFLRIYDRLHRHPRLVLILWVGILVAATALALRLRLKEDIGDFFIADGDAARYMSVYRRIGGQNRIAIIATAPQTDAASRTDSIAAAMLDFPEALAEADTARLVTAVGVATADGDMAAIIDDLLAAAPRLMTEADYRRADSLLAQPGYVAQAVEECRQQLLLPTSTVSAPLLRRDPLHLFTPLLERLHALRPDTGYVATDGIVFTPDRRAGICFVESNFSSTDSGNNRLLADVLDDVCSQLMALHPGVSVTAIGAPLIAVTNADRIRADGLIAGSLSVVLIALILWYVFRRVSDIVWMILSVATGYAIAIAIVGLYRGELSAIVLGTGSMLIGIAANYPLHFLDHLRHEPDRRRALADMVPPLLTGNITTVAAFACLAWMDSEAMRDLGIMGALMLIATIAAVLVFVPIVARSRHREASAPPAAPPSPTPAPAAQAAPPAADATPPSSRRRAAVGVAVVLLTVFFGHLSLRTTFDTDMQHINYMTADQREHLALLGTGIEAAQRGTLLCVAQGTILDAALAASEAVADSLLAAGYAVRSLQGIVPSRQSQEASLRRWQRLCERHAALLRHELPRQASAHGFAPTAFAPFMQLLASGAAPIGTCPPLAGSLAAHYVIAADSGLTQVVTYALPAQPLTPAAKDSLRTRLGHLCFLFDSADLQSSLATALNADFNYIGFFCSIVVFAFLWFSFGSIELSLLSFLPLAVGWVWILGIMQLAGLQFNIVNIILATFIFGQGDDYTIFITDGLIYEHTYGRRVLRSYRRGVLLSAAIMLVGIGSLILARHPAMRSLAEVVIIGMTVVVAMAFCLPPLIFRWLTTRGGRRREVPLTLERLGRSLWAGAFFVAAASAYQLFALIWSHAGPYTERRRLMFHRTLCAVARFCIGHVPGTTWSVDNPHGEQLARPAVIIANHQSQLDLMAVMSIAPKVVVLAKGWVWRNPLYALILRAAEFIPADSGIEATTRRMRDLAGRGYSIVVFPEGTRSADDAIHRFHKGAFELSRALGLDILPVYLTGLGRVLPKGEWVLRRGTMHMEIGSRISPEAPAPGSTTRDMARHVRQLFAARHAVVSRRHTLTADVVPYVRQLYTYKTRSCERQARRRLQAILRQAASIDGWAGGDRCLLPTCGQGELAYVFALVHPDVQVLATDPDPDNIAVALNINIHLPNLRFEVQPHAAPQRASDPNTPRL